MRHVIIGTAGHIDHGKTALIRALTGRDTDRLKEEKKRGITIDLGFTWFDLPGGERAGIIDVPGHEKFIRNMAAGVAGMDLVLLVIAADEGIMPQTREHMDIMELLGVQRYIIVLNKCDLADEEWIGMVETEIRRETRGTILETAPLVRVSAATGSGIDELKARIAETALGMPERESAEGKARLPIDRVFTAAGFGTVVTGTLLEGTIRTGDLLTLYPQGASCRVRGIQVYNQDAESCCAGQRAALNLAGTGRDEIRRGCVLAAPDSIRSGKNVDVRLRLLKSAGRVVKNQTRLHFHSGSAEMLCRAVLLDADSIAPGESCLAQLRMETDTALKPGDRFIVRFYSPVETIGGGVVLEPDAPREKRFRPEVLERLRKREEGAPVLLLELQAEKHGKTMADMEELASELGMGAEAAEYIRELADQGRLLLFNLNGREYVWHVRDEAAARKSLLDRMKQYLEEYPYRPGVPAGILNAVLPEMNKKLASAYAEYLCRCGVLERRGERLAPAGYEIRKDETYCRVRPIILEALANAEYQFIRINGLEFTKKQKEILPELLLLMSETGEIVRLSEDCCTLPSYMENACEKIADRFRGREKITVSEVRDLFDTSRKNAKLILDYTDRIGMTRKNGGESERIMTAFKKSKD